ncbi:DUF3054 domain-containing protein [Propionibacteriaceae bacterium Y1700]|uniref:DUF3054 domain-containing protein n=1 Tax=Microlunatus sp. Y1700 TaxID=3418487 RepID=UPI003DA6D314
MARWLLLDVVLVIVFAAVGRSSHAEALHPLGLLSTSWPFVVATLLAWLVGRFWRVDRRPYRVWPEGLVVWLITVVVGLGLRVLSGDTAQLPFIIVATISLAVLLLGWRLVAQLVLRRRT